jgi:signal peptidase I
MANEVQALNQIPNNVQQTPVPSGVTTESKVPLEQAGQTSTANVDSLGGSLNEKGVANKKSSKKKTRKKKKRKKQAKRFFIKLFIIIAIVFALCYWVVGITPQHGNQMYPSIKDGDLLITLKVGQPYQAGVVCAYKAPDGKMRIGRIVAMPGDKVAFNEKGALILNDLEAMEEYVIPSSQASQSSDTETMSEGEKEDSADGEVVPAGCYYILNDRRAETDDSRTYGAIEESNLRGTAFWQFRKREF